MAQNKRVRPTQSRPERRAFVAFAGGGAKGLAHIGALKAIEMRNVTVSGYAGTSAGAIIAALAASGFHADLIMHPSEQRSIIDELKTINASLKSPVDLFGPGGWHRVLPLRSLLAANARKLLYGLAVVVTIALLVSAVLMVVANTSVRIMILLVWTVCTGLAVLFIMHWLRGVAELHSLRDAIGKLLSKSLFPDDPSRPVRMSDYDGTMRPALKIVAADLTHRKLELFSADTTPDVEVADAIAASICLPLVFNLWAFDSRKFVDGGIVSNLPAWPFDEERALDPEALTIAFAIETPEDGVPKTPGNIDWLPSLLQTSLFGSDTLSLRAVGPSELIVLRPKIKMMDFDLTYVQAQQLLEDVTKAALAEIDERLFRFPETYRAASAQVVELTENTLRLVPQVFEEEIPHARVRAAVAMRQENFVRSLKLRFGANFQNDPDQDMPLPINETLVGVAWKEGVPQFDIAPFPDDLRLPSTRYEALRRRIWPDLAWSLRVPILDENGQTRYVVTVDGSHRLKNTGETREVFEGLIDEIVRIFGLVVNKLEKAK